MLPVRGATLSALLPGAGKADFNPCSPCGERRKNSGMPTSPIYFNPCSPCGERRTANRPSSTTTSYFNPCSPCGERPTKQYGDTLKQLFQSMLPVRGATVEVSFSPACFASFQSMLPVRGATLARYARPWRVHISIHAPRAGSDSSPSTFSRRYDNFNPCSPCGERL